MCVKHNNCYYILEKSKQYLCNLWLAMCTNITNVHSNIGGKMILYIILFFGFILMLIGYLKERRDNKYLEMTLNIEKKSNKILFEENRKLIENIMELKHRT